MAGFRTFAAIAASTGALFLLAGSWFKPLSHSVAETSRGRLGDSGQSLQPEQIANQHYQQALAQATEAVKAYESARDADTDDLRLAYLKRERSLWQSALNQLNGISPHTVIYPRAAAKITQYEALLTTADSKLAEASQTSIAQIVGQSELADEQIHLTLCQIDNAPTLPPAQEYAPFDDIHCRHHQGDQQLASPASLIKLPIAIALMDRLNRNGVSYRQEIDIDTLNFTENSAAATSIEVGNAYPIEVVMIHMIKDSDNIATNQLIDYIGREQMNETMSSRGYSQTFIDFKLAGDQILPANAGSQSNRLTTHDLTAMMSHTFRKESPGDAVVLRALAEQSDREIGYQALQGLSDRIQWIGEKTGQNDRLLGTTLLFVVDDTHYALSVGADHSADAQAVRQLIRDIASYLLEQGPLAPSTIS